MKKLYPLLSVLFLIYWGCDDPKEEDTEKPTVTITSVVFDNNGFNITWSQNNDNDFQSYTLYESQSEDMSGQNEVFTSENNSDTSYTVTGVNEDEERYYQVVVEDVWGYQSLSNIEIGDSHNWFVQTFGGFEPDYGYPVLNFTIFPQL